MSVTPELWTGVKVDMQSVLGPAKTITAISKANPGVITATHDFANGDYVLLLVNGMTELAGVFRVVNISTTVSFQAEAVSGGTGLDTTNFQTFTDGTAQKITFGTSISSMLDLNGSGGDPDKIDTTTIHDVIRKQAYGIPSALEYSSSNLWDISDTGQQKLNEASLAGADRAFKFRFRSGKIMVFSGRVAFSATPTGSAQDKVTSPLSISANTFPRYYTA